MQIVIALVVTPEGLPLAYEVLPGNTADKTTLRPFLEHIERQYGKARRVWLMDRGVPTEEVLAEMRAADPPVHYLVSTPKGRLTRLEKQLIARPWQEARPGVQVKLLPQQGELYVLAQSGDRVAKEQKLAACGCNNAMPQSCSVMSQNCPLPDFSRSCSAIRIAIAEKGRSRYRRSDYRAALGRWSRCR